MASSFLKTFFFVLYGILTFLLLCAVLVLILKDDKSSCSNSPPISKSKLDSLMRESESMNETVDNASETAATKVYDFTGQYELVSSENFDEFLTELGIGYFTRLAATRASSKYIITKDNDYYTLKTVSTFGESSITFKSGVSFKEDRMDGETVDSVINVKGNKWIQKQTGAGEVTIIREFSPEEVVVTSIINEVASVRKYKKIQ